MNSVFCWYILHVLFSSLTARTFRIHMSVPRPIFGVETQQSRLRVLELKLPLTLVSSRVTLEEDWSYQRRLCVNFTERVLSTVPPLAFILETGEIHSTSSVLTFSLEFFLVLATTSSSLVVSSCNKHLILTKGGRVHAYLNAIL